MKTAAIIAVGIMLLAGLANAGIVCEEIGGRVYCEDSGYSVGGDILGRY